ncbi:MAG: 50S ribosomal protein L4 [Patescibacteria group bacterium]
MKATLYKQTGSEAGNIEIPEGVFGLPWNSDLVHQVVTSLRTNMRKPVAHTKNRGEVRGGGKKPWQQKGTGRARHGSSRSPIWVGGGVTHGPRNEKNFSRTVSKKMKAKALYTILSKKFKDGQVVFLDSLTLKASKTKEARGVFESLGKIDSLKNAIKKNNALYIALDKKDVGLERSFQNFGNVLVDESRNLNPLDIMSYKYIVFVNPEVSIGAIARKLE